MHFQILVGRVGICWGEMEDSDIHAICEDANYWIDIKDVVIGPVIGSGEFSTVYGEKWCENGY